MAARSYASFIEYKPHVYVTIYVNVAVWATNVAVGLSIEIGRMKSVVFSCINTG